MIWSVTQFLVNINISINNSMVYTSSLCPPVNLFEIGKFENSVCNFETFNPFLALVFQWVNNGSDSSTD